MWISREDGRHEWHGTPLQQFPDGYRYRLVMDKARGVQVVEMVDDETFRSLPQQICGNCFVPLPGNKAHRLKGLFVCDECLKINGGRIKVISSRYSIQDLER